MGRELCVTATPRREIRLFTWHTHTYEVKIAALVITFALVVVPTIGHGEVFVTSFEKPKDCIAIPAKYGLQPISGSVPAWKNLGLGWFSQSSILTFKGNKQRVGDMDNEITCLFHSSVENRVEFMRLTADCFNSGGVNPTVTKFREVGTGILGDLGVPEPGEIFKHADPLKGKEISTDAYTISLKREAYRIGYGWILTLTAK